MCFPVWRELKLLAYQGLSPPSWQSLNVLSRLKGIETNNKKKLTVFLLLVLFKCAFPFEGNWNVKAAVNSVRKRVKFKCAFPFEGNWNCQNPLHGAGVVRLNVLSRLKGIETRPSLCSLLWHEPFKCAFPFEGNWNTMAASSVSCASSKAFKCAFPFEGNWNSSPWGLQPPLVRPQFKCAFPFEGNWNRIPVVGRGGLLCLNVLSRLKGIETRRLRRHRFPQRQRV